MFQKAAATGYHPVLDKIRQKTLVSGRLELTIGDATHLAGPGDSWCIPGGTPHHARALADCVAIEVFSPVREEYLPQGQERTQVFALIGQTRGSAPCFFLPPRA